MEFMAPFSCANFRILTEGEDWVSKIVLRSLIVLLEIAICDSTLSSFRPDETERTRMSRMIRKRSDRMMHYIDDGM